MHTVFSRSLLVPSLDTPEVQRWNSMGEHASKQVSLGAFGTCTARASNQGATTRYKGFVARHPKHKEVATCKNVVNKLPIFVLLKIQLTFPRRFRLCQHRRGCIFRFWCHERRRAPQGRQTWNLFRVSCSIVFMISEGKRLSNLGRLLFRCCLCNFTALQYPVPSHLKVKSNHIRDAYLHKH